MIRGIVLPSTPATRVARLRYLGGQLSFGELAAIDVSLAPWLHGVVEGGPAIPSSTKCDDLYYLLKDHNGGKAPAAPDPADRWTNPGSTFFNRTCDCIGGQAWVGGFDRYQPSRFAHIYDGWINTDSMIMDARGPRKCFIAVDVPEPGDFVVCASGTPGHAIGHIMGATDVPAGFDRKNRAHWLALRGVDVAARRNASGPTRANMPTSAIGWYGTNASFIRSIMTP